jgi:phosphoglycerate dehydrogenase-like enzyme
MVSLHFWYSMQVSVRTFIGQWYYEFMTKKLLATDSFFLKEDNIEKLKAAGYEVIHLDLPAATEAELIEAIQDVSVYILGGIEQVTDTVINAADKLEAIIFCGVDYDKFIPGAELAKSKGVQLFNAPGVNAVAVAEFAIGTALLMQRQLVGISRSGDKRYLSTDSIQGSVVGVIGAGNVGRKIIEGVVSFTPNEIIFYNRSSQDVPFARQVELEELVASSDIIFLALPMKAGLILDANLISRLKEDMLLVSISPMNLIDIDSLSSRLIAGNVRAVIDWPSPTEELASLPLETFYTVNSHSAYNTEQAIKLVAEHVTDKAISIL